MSRTPPIFKWQQRIRDSPTLSPRARLVAFCLATWMHNETLEARPTVATIAVGCGVSRSTVFRGLAELERARFLDREPGRTGRATRYYGSLL